MELNFEHPKVPNKPHLKRCGKRKGLCDVVKFLDLRGIWAFGLQGRGGAQSYIFVSRKSEPLEIGGSIMHNIVKLHLLQEGRPRREVNRKAKNFERKYLEDDLKDVLLRH